jgi:hypothetical protein
MTLLGPSRAEGAAPTAIIAGFSCSLSWSFTACRSLYPGGSAGCIYRLLPPHGSTSPLVRRVVFRSDFFEASSGFHLRYGLLLRGITYVILSIEGSDKFVSSLAASIATGQSDHSQAGLSPAVPKQVSRRTDQTSPRRLVQSWGCVVPFSNQSQENRHADRAQAAAEWP